MSNTTTITTTTADLSNPVKYITLQIYIIPSILCSLFTLARLLFNGNVRIALHNHISLILLIIALFDSLLSHPVTLTYLRLSDIVPSTDSMCLFWNFSNSIFTVSTYWTMAWGSIERHLLVFNSVLFRSQRGRIVFHYIPYLFATFLYPVVANAVVILFFPCENRFNMESLFCGFPCSLKIPSVALYTRFAHNFLPTLIVAICTIGLIVRIIKHRQHIQRNQFNWRRYRRMIRQLLTLASLFLALSLPATTVSIIQNCGLPTFAATIQVSYFNFLLRFLTLSMPFICLSSFPEFWPKLQLHRIFRACFGVFNRVEISPNK